MALTNRNGLTPGQVTLQKEILDRFSALEAQNTELKTQNAALENHVAELKEALQKFQKESDAGQTHTLEELRADIHRADDNVFSFGQEISDKLDEQHGLIKPLLFALLALLFLNFCLTYTAVKPATASIPSMSSCAATRLSGMMLIIISSTSGTAATLGNSRKERTMPVYRDEKTKKYYAKFYYKDWRGQRHQKLKRGFSRSQEAKKYERDFLNELTQGSLITFEHLCQHYLSDNEGRLKPTTQYTSKNIIQNWLLPVFSDMPINQITPLMIRKWQTELMQHSNLAPTYQRSINTKLSALFNYAVKYYNLPENPVRKAGTIGSSRSPHLSFWTLDEFKTFLSGLTDEEDVSFRVAFTTLFFTGLRLGELLALTPADCDFQAHTLRINKNYVQVTGAKIIQTPKTSKSNRTISIPLFLCKVLQTHINRLYSPDQRIFFNLNKSSLTRKLKATARETGVKVIRLHDLRHSHASLLIEMGFSPLVIADRLGHEKITTTLQIYSHLYPNKQAEVAEKLDTVDFNF